jgi:hypothetical protein
MNSTIRKFIASAALLATLVTTGCASFGTEGQSGDARTGDGILHNPDDNVAIQQMKESSRLGGE